MGIPSFVKSCLKNGRVLMGCDHKLAINTYFMLLAPVFLRSNVGDGIYLLQMM